MAGIEILMGVAVGLTVLLGIVLLITMVVTKMNAKEIDNVQIVYLSKMSNTDSSIQDAVMYIKLTNGINMNVSGDKGNA